MKPLSRTRAQLIRWLALYRARQMGWLRGRTQIDLAACLGVDSSTISRDFRDLAAVDSEAEKLLAKLAPKNPE